MPTTDQGFEEPNFNARDEQVLADILSGAPNHSEVPIEPAYMPPAQGRFSEILDGWSHFHPREKVYAEIMAAGAVTSVYSELLFHKPNAYVFLGAITTGLAAVSWMGRKAFLSILDQIDKDLNKPYFD